MLSSAKTKQTYKVQVWLYVRTLSRRSPLRVLLLKTKPSRGAFWQPVTGHVENGETLLQAAKREACEETGLMLRQSPEKIGAYFRFESKWTGACEEHGFSVCLKLSKKGEFPELKLDPGEHTDYEWVSPTKALKMIKFGSNRRILRKLLKKIRK